MESYKKMSQDDLTKYFENVLKNPPITNPKQMIDYKEDMHTSPEEEVKNFIKLPGKFKPTDFAYHQIGDFFLIGLCGGNTVIFVYFEPSTKVVHLIPQKNTILFPNSNLIEELRVIKAGCIYTDRESGKREEVFVTAGKFGTIYLFKVIKLKESFKMIKFEAHFNQINDLCFAPCDLRPELRNLLLSCSNDGSMIIWNIYLASAIICIKPNKLPLDDVLSVDWEYPGDQIVSAHLDAVRVWSINGEILGVIRASHEVSKKHNSLERKEFNQIDARIKNFHDFFVDSVKMLPSGCIITKSVEGSIFVWTYQQVTSKEWHVIPFNKYKTLSSMFEKNNYQSSYFKISVNAFDNLIVAPAEKVKIRVFNLKSSEPLAFKKFKLAVESSSMVNDGEEVHIMKAFILDQELDYIFAITNDSKLWFHQIQDLELVTEKQ